MSLFGLLITLGLLGSTIASAAAQTSPLSHDPAPGQETINAATFIGRRDAGVLRASDFIGRDVYGPNQEVIGEVEDVLFGPDGRISGLVLEVGGFLGVGEREVAVPIHVVRINPATTATTGSIAGLPPSTPAAAEARQDNRISNVVYPERIILPVPLESLRSAPPFQDNVGARSR